MNSARHFAKLLLFAATSLSIGGCYTQLASNRGDYYGYTGRMHRHRVQPAQSDTLIVQEHPSSTVSAQREAVQYDTTYKGDTVFIDERPRADYSYPNGGEVVENYYGDAYPYDYYSPGLSLSLGFGWPYHSWYSPWYSYYPSWYYPYDWGYPGFYPPVYDAYAPFYGFYGYPGFGYGFGGGYYGYGFHHHDFFDHGFHGDGLALGGPRLGRIGGGERRAGGAIITTASQPATMTANRSRGEVSNSIATSTPSADRNAPIHAVAPGNGGPVTYNSTGSTRTATNMTASPIRTRGGYGASVGANAGAQQQAGTPAPRAGTGSSIARTSTVTSTPIQNVSTASAMQNGHRMVVIRRGGASSSYRAANMSTTRSYNNNVRASSAGYGSRAAAGNSGAGRASSAPARSGGSSSSGRSGGGGYSGGGGGARPSGGESRPSGGGGGRR